MKQCKICKVDKELSEFYNHPKTKDGYSQTCKECTKIQSNLKYNKLKDDPNFIEKERKRHRNKYKKYNYKNNNLSSNKALINREYRKKFPEKYKAHFLINKDLKEEGFDLHHWSYNEEHYSDCIKLTKKDHMKGHRFMIYDQERMMYRKLDGVLLDMKEVHEEYIRLMILTQED